VAKQLTALRGIPSRKSYVSERTRGAFAPVRVVDDLLDRSIDIAWAAGLFEGEGCFYVALDRRKKVTRATLRMTDKDVVERFARIVGVGCISANPQKQGEPSQKPIWTWSTNKQSDVLRFVDLVEPYLGSRRRAKALELRATLRRLAEQREKHCAICGQSFTVNVLASSRLYCSPHCVSRAWVRNRLLREQGGQIFLFD
jgi:hypothetical protein